MDPRRYSELRARVAWYVYAGLRARRFVRRYKAASTDERAKLAATLRR